MPTYQIKAVRAFALVLERTKVTNHNLFFFSALCFTLTGNFVQEAAFVSCRESSAMTKKVVFKLAFWAVGAPFALTFGS